MGYFWEEEVVIIGVSRSKGSRREEKLPPPFLLDKDGVSEAVVADSNWLGPGRYISGGWLSQYLKDKDVDMGGMGAGVKRILGTRNSLSE